jgi:hypothetical protein
MSKTWAHRQPYTNESNGTPQAAIDRVRKAEARKEIREALQAPQEATTWTLDSAKT